MSRENKYCLVLSGGGARGGYQAGALRALFEICRDAHNFEPFRNLVGVSAGAINATYVASEIDNLDRGTTRMCNMWRSLTTDDVFATDYITVARTAPATAACHLAGRLRRNACVRPPRPCST